MFRWFTVLGMILLAGLCAIGIIFAQDNARLYVVNALSENISVIDIGTDTVVGTIPLGVQGYQIAFSPDGHTAFVTGSPGRGQKVPAQLASIDLQAKQVSGLTPLEIYPLATVHVHPNGKQAFVVTAAPPGARNGQRGQVLFVDIAAGKVVQRVPVGLNPLGSAMTPDGGKLFTADWASRSISVVDLGAARLKDTLPLGLAAARTLAMTPDGKKVYAILERQFIVQNNMANNSNAAFNNAQTTAQVKAFPVEDKLLWEIDTATDAVTKYPLEQFGPVYALAISPDGKALFAYGRTNSPQQVKPQTPSSRLPRYDLVQINLSNKRIIKRYGNYGYLSTLALSPDGKKLYLIGTPGDPTQEAQTRAKYTRAVANQSVQNANPDKGMADVMQDLSQLSKTVTILDTKTGNRLKTLTIGSLPQGSGLSPR